MFNYVPIYLLAFAISFGVCVPVCKRLIPTLKKKAAQPIYEGGPFWHSAKSGTPTLGGASFVISVLLAALLSCSILFMTGSTKVALSVISVVGFGLLCSLVGLIDDLTKLKRKHNAGLTPMQKLVLQTVFSAAFLFVRHGVLCYPTDVIILDKSIDLGLLYYPAAIFVLLGIVNCANLTDGIDGLAASVSLAIGVCLFLISAYSYQDSAIISAMLCGGALGFLVFNVNPAKIFMGDTGSLFLGAQAAGVVFCLGNPFLSILFGGVYVIEGFSVVLQVLSYKTRRKRIFIMSPIHHHLEKIGWNESKICLVAVIVTLVLSIPAFLLI